MKKLIISIVILQNTICFALKPDSVYHIKPNLWGLMYKEYDVKTNDNYKLKAWFYPAQEALSTDSMKYYFDKKTELRPYATNKNKIPTIIVCNGDAGNMSQLLSYAYNLSTNGFNVITFDWRGFGKSQKFPIDTSQWVYTEFITDYNSVIDFAKQIESVDSNKIGICGFSTGAFLSYAVATSRTDIKALVARGIFSSYKESILLDLKNIDTNNIAKYYPPEIDNYCPKNTWFNFRIPLLLIVGENDITTPVDESIKILTNVKSNIRELWIVPNAQHGGKLAPEIIEYELFFKKVIRFFYENLNTNFNR